MQQTTKHLVIQRGLRANLPGLLIGIPAALISYGALPLFIAADIYLFIFQNTYFRTFAIPLLRRSDYMKIDRQKLSKLSFTQKINCVYCGYANGIVAYLKAVVNQMEVYSCAIKHSVGNKATTHQKSFYKYEDFK